MNASYETKQFSDLAQIEESRSAGVLAGWEQLLERDPTGTLFQGPIWCLEWYRVYEERYQPLMLVVMHGDYLVGLVPLAVERASGELVFASGIMSDYRDVLARPQHKEYVVTQLLQFICAESFPSPLRLGPMLPESNTVEIIRAACEKVSGAYAIPRSHLGWRWWPVDNSAVEFVKKKSVRQAIKHYRRQGELRLDRIDTLKAWHDLKREFFDQHSLRQVYTGRPVSFNDELKQEFYERLFRDNLDSVHVVVLGVGGRIIAAHYGPVRDQVLYWGAPAFDIRETQRSPGLVLLAMIIQDAKRLGLRGIDLTIGVEEYKKRFSNSHVDLPTVEIYRGSRSYYSRVLRDKTVNAAKSLAAKWRGPDTWDRAKEHLDKTLQRLRAVPERGVANSVARLTRRGVQLIGERAKWLTLIAKPSDIREIKSVRDEASYTFNANELGDLLKWNGQSSTTEREIAARVRRAPDDVRRRRTLHTLLVDGKLACWGYSYWPEGPELIDVTQTEINFKPNSVSLYDFYTIPEYRGRRLYQTLLRHILRTRFAEGAEHAYIMVSDTNIASRKAIERVGFRLLMVDEIVRVFSWKRTRHANPDAVAGG